jgi:hypothetical protein
MSPVGFRRRSGTDLAQVRYPFETRAGSSSDLDLWLRY